jgi:hypothetical protein
MVKPNSTHYFNNFLTSFEVHKNLENGKTQLNALLDLLVKYAKLGIILGLLGPSFREIEDEMRSQDEKGTEGKKTRNQTRFLI